VRIRAEVPVDLDLPFGGEPVERRVQGAGLGHARRPDRTAERRRRGADRAEQPRDPENLAVAEGEGPTPENVEPARQELAERGPVAIERTVP
jgi:hypothetical protein